MAYASATDLIARYDARLIGDLVADDNTQVAPADLSGNTKLAAALDDASGDIDAALLASRRYSADDLSGLTGTALAHLKRMTCDIAMSYLRQRRADWNPEQVKAFMEVAEAHLERLRKGINVFGLDDQMDAGLPEVGGPTTVDYQNLNLMRDRVMNYYPARRLPNNR